MEFTTNRIDPGSYRVSIPHPISVLVKSEKFETRGRGGRLVQKEVWNLFFHDATEDRIVHQYRRDFTQKSEAVKAVERVLPAYIEGVYNKRFHNQSPDTPRQVSDDSTAMTTKRAREILGVSDHATRQDINSAHRSLIAKFHSDAGGSHYLAVLINLAREHLLKA